MTYEFEYLMHLFSCGARGTKPQPPRQPVDFERLMQLAQEHSVLPLVGIALSNVKNTGFPIEKVRELVINTRKMAFANYIKRRQVLKLLQDFEAAGIQAILLKGYTVADLYAEPDCRISSDTDIYVNIKDEKQAYKLLKSHGCQVNPRSPISHHAACDHPKMGHIELHVILYGNIEKDVWFKEINSYPFMREAYEKNACYDGSYNTLGKTDNLIFLALHMIKHFISSGTSLRQMMDIALFLSTYKEQIDLKRFWDVLESLRYEKLMSTILSVLVSYCSFSSEQFGSYEMTEETSTHALLTDLEVGGWLGYSKMDERKVAKYRYNRIRYLENQTSFSYWCYMIKRIVNSYFHALFPTKSSLEKKYRYINSSILLVPFAWIHRLLFGLWKLLHGKMYTGIVLQQEQASVNEKDRFHLFKLMNMI